jgi:GTP-binding protein
MPLDGSDPAANYKTIRGELEHYSKVLAGKQEVIVVNKMDLDHSGKKVKELKKKLKKDLHPISAVTGKGVKELTEFLWQKVKKTKGQDYHSDRP